MKLNIISPHIEYLALCTESTKYCTWICFRNILLHFKWVIVSAISKRVTLFWDIILIYNNPSSLNSIMIWNTKYIHYHSQKIKEVIKIYINKWIFFINQQSQIRNILLLSSFHLNTQSSYTSFARTFKWKLSHIIYYTISFKIF